MAEIWVAHQKGPAGFQKDVVLKKILPHLAEDQKFIDMFLDEARLAAQLSHPNIVQIFDLGEVDGEHFIAMEFIDGRDVQAIIDRGLKVRQPFSPAIAARIVADACTALDYAHNFTNKAGTHIQLVHRDVSPQNILVSKDGIVKLVDFGVAKAATSTHKTQTGAVKGKLSYMSPEQISGKMVDARSDIFALGIVLYELVTGRRPFGHESELLAITAILNEQPQRPCEIIHTVPAELEAIIFKALEKDPAIRFQSASEMQLALEQVLQQMEFRRPWRPAN
jgi:serine/threonine-protein kinase